ncbi:MAG: hypothetical protein CL993_00090, partial [Euryarchaeota archaeon]|nr:hypothetical protein [Euryarchaeota archaeon]
NKNQKNLFAREIEPYELSKIGMLDDIINPNETRLYLVRALRRLQTKRELLFSKKHGNIPL